MAWWRRRTSARDGIQDDVRDEFASHVELRIQENLRRGMSPAEAGREAATRFGPVGAVAVDCEKIQRRRESRARALWLDIRSSWLGWRRSPWISLLGAVVGAIGMATALVAALIADAAFLRQPPGMHADDRVFGVFVANDGSRPQRMSYQVSQRLAAAAPEHQFFVWTTDDFQLSVGTRSGIWSGVYVGGDYFNALQITAAAGRLLDRDDELARRPVVVLSGRLARDLFESSVAAVGQTLRVNGRPMAIAGVTGGGFRGASSTERADIWLPVTVEALFAVPQTLPSEIRVQSLAERADTSSLMGGVRLSSADRGVETQTRYTAAYRSIPRTGAEASKEDRRDVQLLDRPWLSPAYEREQLAAVMKPAGVAVGLTLLLTAACMSSLLVGRLIQRQRELAVRLALGASRWRIARLVIIEHAIVTVAAAALACPLALAAFVAIDRLQIASGISVASIAVGFDARALVVLLGLAVVLGVTSLLGPLAFVRANTRAATVIAGNILSSGTTLRRALMAAQVATGCALLAAGGLLTRTIDQLLAQPRGFDSEQVAFVEIDLGRAGLDAAARVAAVDKLRARTRDAGEAIALTTARPYPGNDYEWIHVDVPDRVGPARPLITMISRIEGPYFAVVGIRVVVGRLFTETSRTMREAIVSETFAQHYWPGQNALGRIINVGGARSGEPREVVGVVAATRDLSLRGGQSARLYLPFEVDVDRLLVVARRVRPRPAVSSELTPLVAQIDERLVPTRSGVLEDLALQTIEQRHVIRWMTLAVGAGSLLMVAVGVWGLAHASVNRRWREFGLRLALGAKRGDIARLALRDAVIVATAGVGLGVVAAWQFGRALSSFLFGVAPTDPMIISASAVVVATAVFAGAWFPARRASRADPSHLLRTS